VKQFLTAATGFLLGYILSIAIIAGARLVLMVTERVNSNFSWILWSVPIGWVAGYVFFRTYDYFHPKIGKSKADSVLIILGIVSILVLIGLFIKDLDVFRFSPAISTAVFVYYLIKHRKSKTKSMVETGTQ